ncbi:hypothetical protein [Pyrococcus kukulkanii]|uniref:hypothetical protein n=1 Tax=Pyrococcus kukulkanii TaxID=1609559 RepID=UPI00356ACF2A
MKSKWEELKVQVLLEDDEVPEGASVLPEDELLRFLESQDVKTKVIIAGEFYKVKLRGRVPREKYLEFLGNLKSFLGFKPPWDKEEKALLIRRWRK